MLPYLPVVYHFTCEQGKKSKTLSNILTKSIGSGCWKRTTWKHKPYHSWQLVFRNPPGFMRISWNLVDFTWNPVDFMKSTWKPYKSNNSTKTLQFYGVQWEGYASWFTWNLLDFTVKSTRFHKIRKYELLGDHQV